MQTLNNKIVFITGASSGIGEAIAHAFAAQGARLILTARRLDKLTALAETLHNKYQTQCLSLPLDVCDAKKIHSLFEELPNHWREIDILINNAGLASYLGKIYEASVADIDAIIDTNVKGVLYLISNIVPGMVSRNRGQVINIGSIAGHEVYPNGAIYCASKFAIRAISQGLKMDCHGTKVRVSSIDPGLVQTNFSKVRFKGDAARAEKVYADTAPLHANDIAEACVYAAACDEHINISDIVVLATAQSAATMVHREPQSE